MSRVRRNTDEVKKAPGNRDVSPRGLALLVAAVLAGYLVMENPKAATPALVAVAVLTVLNQLVRRDRDRDSDQE
ncbi:hypothetical protein ABZ780_04345 [Micromonospora sp. NPDC047467]|uniref:hypothetical protein n=1 Tax=Micromonospora sp. NPDC047467 TaxID=3154814 RepID=UPI0033C34446